MTNNSPFPQLKSNTARTTKLGSGELTTTLKIYPHKHWHSCTSVEVGFTLKLDDGQEPLAVGGLLARIVDKTLSNEAGQKLWLHELLGFSKYPADKKEDVTYGMSCLFGANAVLRRQFRQFEELKDDRILFIDNFSLHEAYQKHGLGGHCLTALHSLFPALSGALGVDLGTAILLPCAIPWMRYDRSKEEVKASLIKFYGTHGYEVYVQPASETKQLAIMGKRL